MQSAEKLTDRPGTTLAERVAEWRYLGASSFLFAFLQAVCPAFVAIGAVRVFIGLGALATAAGAGALLQAWHADSIRIPMMLIAALGAALNLFVIWQMRRLRARPAAQWRVKPLEPGKLRSERWQILLAILTFVCLAVEESMHWYFHHHH
jgi:hypothetical protein